MKSEEGLDYWSPKDNQIGLEETIYVKHVVWHLMMNRCCKQMSPAPCPRLLTPQCQPLNKEAELGLDLQVCWASFPMRLLLYSLSLL